MNRPNCMRAPNLYARCRGRRGGGRERSRKVEDLDPVRVLAHRIFLELRELAARLIDRVARQTVRELTDREEIAAGRIDPESARLLLGGYAADRRQGALRRVDLEAGQGARRALRAVEELAVGRDVKIGGRGLALEIGRQRADDLLLREVAAGGVVVEDVDVAVELPDDVDELAARLVDEVARAGLRLRLGWLRGGRRQLAGRRVEPELIDAIVAQGR